MNEASRASDPRPTTIEFARGLVRRQLVPVVAAVLLSLCVATIYIVLTPPKYTATASLILDTRKIQVFDGQPPLTGFAIDPATVDSQVEIIRSEHIATAVLERLGLENEPEFNPKPGYLQRLLTNLTTHIRGAQPQSDQSKNRKLAQRLSSQLAVRRASPTYIIHLSFTSTSPARAALIANTFAEQYISDQRDARSQAAREASKWLEKRSETLKEQTHAAEEAVVEYRTKTGLVTTNGRLITDHQLTEQTNQLLRAEAETASAKARLDRAMTLRLDDLGTFSTDLAGQEVFNRLRHQLLDLNAREAQLSARLEAGHPALASLRNQRDELTNAIATENKRIQEGLKSEFETALLKEHTARKSLEQAINRNQAAASAEVRLKELESKARSLRALYDTFVRRNAEAVQQESSPFTDARLMTPATRPLERSSPKIVRTLGLAGIAGILIGITAGLYRELSDRTFRTSDQIRSSLHLPCWSIVPAQVFPRAATPAKGAIPPSQTAEHHRAPLALIDEMQSVALMLRMAHSNVLPQIVGLTSTLPGEGKTTLAWALAHALAQTGARVLIIDLDLRNPALTRYIGANSRPSLTDVLAGEATLALAVVPTTNSRLKVLPATSPNQRTSVDLLGRPELRKLTKELRSHFDHVILDLPPLLPVVDVRAAKALVDGFIYIVEWGRTQIEIAQRALDDAPEVKAKCMGTILNKVDSAKAVSYGESMGYGYSDVRPIQAAPTRRST